MNCWTPEQIAKAQLLRDSGQSLAKVAKAVGKTENAVRNKLHKSAPREDRSELQDAKKRIANLERQLSHAHNALEKARKPRVKITPATIRKTAGEFVRVIIPDSHGCFIDPDAASAFLADLQALAPSEIVMLGDHIDCGGFLAQHHAWGYVAEADYSYEDDVSAANAFLDSIQAAAPSARIHYLEGNHERRVETWCLTQALRSKKDSEFLLRQFSVEQSLSFEARGIAFYKQGRFYDGCRKPHTIKLGHCYFTHGDKCGVHAARQTLKEFGGNVVFGHTHTSAEASSRTVSEGTVKAWNPGSLSKLQPLWRHGALTEWNHGYGVQFVNASGNFLHVNVPIIDGKSFLIPFTRLAS